jgi:hypothetical protein
MTTPRPTVGQVSYLNSQLLLVTSDRDAALAQVRALEADLQAMQTDREAIARQINHLDLEARCISECVKALDDLRRGKENQRARNQYAWQADWVGRAPALSSDVGRVLLHLAARYGVEIEASPAPEVQRDASSVMVMPTWLADQLSRLPQEVLNQGLG